MLVDGEEVEMDGDKDEDSKHRWMLSYPQWC